MNTFQVTHMLLKILWNFYQEYFLLCFRSHFLLLLHLGSLDVY